MNKQNNPTSIFLDWFEQELKLSTVQIPTATCLSTVGIDGFPNARFVSFKEIIDDCFVITGPFNSRKGIDIENNNKVSLTFWWTETERQVRVQGIATKISEQLADTYFSERSINSRAVSSVCEQGKQVDNLNLLEKKVLEKISTNEVIERPKDWGGFAIKPIRIEFMQFKKTRFHDRKLYEFTNGKWNVKQIQP